MFIHAVPLDSNLSALAPRYLLVPACLSHVKDNRRFRRMGWAWSFSPVIAVSSSSVSTRLGFKKCPRNFYKWCYGLDYTARNLSSSCTCSCCWSPTIDSEFRMDYLLAWSYVRSALFLQYGVLGANVLIPFSSTSLEQPAVWMHWILSWRPDTLCAEPTPKMV